MHAVWRLDVLLQLAWFLGPEIVNAVSEKTGWMRDLLTRSMNTRNAVDVFLDALLRNSRSL